MTERYHRMQETAFQIIMGALVAALLAVCGFIAKTTVDVNNGLAVNNEKLQININDTKENQEQIYKIRWEFAQWQRDQELR